MLKIKKAELGFLFIVLFYFDFVLFCLVLSCIQRNMNKAERSLGFGGKECNDNKRQRESRTTGFLLGKK